MTGEDGPEGDDAVELPEVVTWTPEHALDHFAVWADGAIRTGLRVLIVLTALVILSVITAVTGLSLVTDPLIFSLVVLSVVPALGLAVFIWWADVGAEEPLTLLLATFLLGMLFAAFAAVLNTIGFAIVGIIPVVTMLLFFYLVVGPVEEGVKLLAVRLFAYRHPRFDAVIDGAVYGAVAGLGFATIENAIYITATIDVFGQPAELLGPVGETAAVRALAGPGHVIYSAIAGYYLGLAKFNPSYAGPLIIKGITIAALIHATYNVTVQVVPGVLVELSGISIFTALLAFIIVYDGMAAYYLYRKLARYRRAYRATKDIRRGSQSPELIEFDSK